MEKHFGHYVRILHWCTDQSMTNALENMELTAAQGHIMGFLAHRKEPPCPRDIEQALQLSHPTVSGLLTRLEKKGFIALRPDPADKRCKRIYILPRGQACHQHMIETMDATEKKLLQDFTPQEQMLFSQLLDRAITNIGGTLRRPTHEMEE